MLRPVPWIIVLLMSTLSCGGSSPTVVFAGDSLTYNMQGYWQQTMPLSARYFINEGIDGDTSAALLARFRTDVISQKASVVHILIGTNDSFDDIKYGNFPPEVTERNIISMITLAQASGKRVILATIPPTMPDYPDPSTATAVNAHIRVLNDWIRSQTGANGPVLADYYPVLVDSGFLNPAYCIDGHVHLNELGYEQMAPVTLQAVAATQ
jgi:lysophospholipase L1-like esterase